MHETLKFQYILTIFPKTYPRLTIQIIVQFCTVENKRAEMPTSVCTLAKPSSGQVTVELHKGTNLLPHGPWVSFAYALNTA